MPTFKNFSSELTAYLPQQILKLLLDAGDKANKLGQDLFLVGGVVRDLFLNRTNSDLDLVIEGDAIKLAQGLSENRRAKLIAHPRFGTAKLCFTDFSLDIATARRESYSQPGALPAVKPGTITDDLCRRDFTINAMSFRLTPQRFGELIDLYHGKDDIDHQLIRILHPNSFIDDATRILRALRYEQRLDFRLEPFTDKLLRRDAAMLNTISGDRLRHELELILKEECPERIFKRSEELGVLNKLHPSLEGNGWLSERFNQARQLYKRSLPSILYLCLLVYNLTDNENERFLSHLNLPKRSAQSMRQTLHLKKQLQYLDNPQLKPSDIYQLLVGYTIQAIQANMLASESHTIRQHLQLYLIKLRLIKPHLTGNDLLEMGFPASPRLGEILNALHEAKLNGKVRTRKEEEKLVYSLHPGL